MLAWQCWQESELEDCLLGWYGQKIEHEGYVSENKVLHGRH